ncbi:MAG: glutathionylspermidine synthase family protein [Parasporobacterium sp.]|nr:glutathionylspermidine synthase family protein [Parasporobacterium sp.]
MRLQKEVFEAYKEQIKAHPEENRRGALAVRDSLEHSPLFWNDCVDKTVQIPKIYDEQTIEEFRRITKVTHRIFEKVIREYREKADFRALFPFSKELEELILLPAPYPGELPIARFDLFYQEDTGKFYFCEINTDGTAAMLRDLEMGKALINNPAHQAVIRQYDLEPFELFDTWVETFLNLYNTWPKKKDCPNVAMVDFLENATLRDFEEFARRFQKAGVNCEICDIRRLEYRDGVLYSPTGNRIDAIYRRAVTADIMDHYQEVSAFLDAVREDAVFLAGAFATQIIHTKWLFYVLHHERTKAFLEEEELAFIKEHVPLTVEFAPEYITLDEVQKNKDAYIIKPMDAYASKGVYAAGREYGQKEWETLAGELYGKRHICQQYCPQYLTDNIDYAWGDGEWHPYINMPGLYVYNGVFSGILMRMACGENIIVAHENERTVPAFTVKGRKG